MPVIFEPNDLPVFTNDGLTIATLADRRMLGTDALQVKRITLEAHARSPIYEAANAERFAYVIRGMGQAHVRKQEFHLVSESMLWIEKDDRFYLVAGAEGLEVLLCHAPARD